MIGTQRSGSNMLRLMLGRLPEVFAPPSTHVIEDFSQLIGSYGDLRMEENLRLLIGDVIRVIETNVLKWPAHRLSVDRVLERCRGASLEHVYSACHDAAAESGCTAWVSKSLENVSYLDRLQSAIPDLAVLHLIRDPRDVALSFATAPIGPKHPAMIGWAWARDQYAAAAARELFPARRWAEIRYEALVDRTHETIAELCRAYNLQFSKDVTEFYRAADAQYATRRSSLWLNLDKPVQGKNVGRHRQPQHRAFVHMVESAAYDAMTAYGYKPLYATHQHEYSPVEVKRIEQEDESLRQAHPEQCDSAVQAPHDVRRGVLEEIRATRA
ncbi:sulfotransferase family protein [Nonomuraea sp. KM90]|uniref:sulfotransferase family protein n=1 Tax=Nonomuraea sp. KM90 TaxID=3457428 RepID=UPI003FCE0E49